MKLFLTTLLAVLIVAAIGSILFYAYFTAGGG